MRLKAYLPELGVVAMLVVLGFAFGHDVGTGKAAQKLAAANVDAAIWQSSAQASEGALQVITARLKQQRSDLAAVRRIADEALAQRDSANHTNAQLREQLKSALLKAAHEDPDCADLAQPLCPAVARRLFGEAGGGSPPGH